MADKKIKKLIKKLGNRNWHVWNSASEKLVNAGPIAAESLIAVLDDKVHNPYYVRERAAEILGKIGVPYATESLIKAVGDASDSVRSKAARALGKIGDPIAVKPLINCLKDGDKSVRQSAAESLGEIGDLGSAQPLISSLADIDGNIRCCAADALGKIGNPKAVPHLITALQNDDFLQYRNLQIPPYKVPLAPVRSSAAKALGKIGSPDAVQHLTAALKDTCSNVRESAIEALGEIGIPGVTKTLITALETDKDVFVRKRATEALARFSDPNIAEPLVTALKNDDSEFVRNAAAAAIDNIMKSNIPLQKYFPHLLCSKCFLKTVKKQIIRIEIFKDYTIVACRHCKTWVHLVKNVTRVVGVIGGDIEDFHIDDETVYVGLWSELQKKARNADIDVLEIRYSEGLSYDYAINAVLITLKNDVSRSKEYVKQIPVVIQDNTPIPQGAEIILSHEFGKLKR